MIMNRGREGGRERERERERERGGGEKEREKDRWRDREKREGPEGRKGIRGRGYIFSSGWERRKDD